MRAMDIAVAPYPHLEEFYFSPLKVFEYMATGLPVMAKQLFFCNLTESDLRSDSPVV